MATTASATQDATVPLRAGAPLDTALRINCSPVCRLHDDEMNLVADPIFAIPG